MSMYNPNKMSTEKLKYRRKTPKKVNVQNSPLRVCLSGQMRMTPVS